MRRAFWGNNGWCNWVVILSIYDPKPVQRFKCTTSRNTKWWCSYLEHGKACSSLLSHLDRLHGVLSYISLHLMLLQVQQIVEICWVVVKIQIIYLQLTSVRIKIAIFLNYHLRKFHSYIELRYTLKWRNCCFETVTLFNNSMITVWQGHWYHKINNPDIRITTERFLLQAVEAGFSFVLVPSFLHTIYQMIDLTGYQVHIQGNLSLQLYAIPTIEERTKSTRHTHMHLSFKPLWVYVYQTSAADTWDRKSVV